MIGKVAQLYDMLSSDALYAPLFRPIAPIARQYSYEPIRSFKTVRCLLDGHVGR